MRQLVEQLVRQRNKAFSWPKGLPASALYSFIWQQAWNMVRGLRTWIRFRPSRYMMRGKGVVIKGMSMFRWGTFLKLGDHVHIDAFSAGGMILGNSVSIGAYSHLVASGSISHPGVGIKIGNNVGIGEFAYLGGGGGLEIGDDCIAGQYLSCHPENHVATDPALPIRLQGVTRKGIKIGANCWLGSKVTILDGVTIGRNCIVAAGAVVTSSFPDNSVIGGVPARLLKHTFKKEYTQELVEI